MYIYKITDITNTKIYIGTSIVRRPNATWRAHQLKAGTNDRRHLYVDMRRHGVNKFEIIEHCSTLEELKQKESQYIDSYNRKSKEYRVRRVTELKLYVPEKAEQIKISRSNRALHAEYIAWARRFR